tara:strand:+ start:4266 stop:4811 length:546 start_codon:yes stop_codon:yes gene_type:complete
MSLLKRLSGALATAFAVSHTGASYAYPEYMLKPELLYRIYTKIPFDKIPNEVISASMIGLMASTAWFASDGIFKKGKYGKAEWGTLKTAKQLKLLKSDKGIILGKKKGKYLVVTEPLSVLLLAPPGTGKSAGCAIPTLLTCPWSIIAIDIKGELADKTAHVREKFSNVMIFDPYDEKFSQI